MPDALGQHFLADERAVRRVVDAADLRPGETVLDVGAGLGALAKECLRRVRPDGKVVAVEVQAGFVRQLRSEAREGLEVVHGDALEVPLPRADAVVANPPFRVASPLLFRLLDAGFGRAVLVLPRELAERLLATPGHERYGRLTVEIALRARVTPLFGVPRSAFDPPPRVPVLVARVDPLPPPDVDARALGAVLDAAWANKRRTLRRGLGSLGPALRISSGLVTEVLRGLDLEEATPLETPPEDFLAVAQAVGAALAARREPPGETAHSSGPTTTR